MYLGNSRGSVYSMEHQFLTVKDQKFWEWSFQDTRLDIKAIFDHIYSEMGPKKQKIHYIGHSMGGVGMLAGLADPIDRETAKEISDRLDTFYCLAPVVYSVSEINQQFLILEISRNETSNLDF